MVRSARIGAMEFDDFRDGRNAVLAPIGSGFDRLVY